MNSFLHAAFRALTPTLAALCLLSPLAARAQSVIVMARLGGDPNGYYPQTPLVKGTDGTLYGTTAQGGAPNYGTVYKISTAGKVTTIYAFPGGAGGSAPMAGLVLGKDGNLYGTTSKGGTTGNGTVFRVTTAGAVTVLHSFSALSNGTYGTNADGAIPQAGLLLGTDGNFYGTASGGGRGDAGTVFTITPAGVFRTLHNFAATSTADIFAPTTGLVQGTDGNFYGTAQGGDDNYDGAVFRMTPAGAVTRIRQFTGGKTGSGPGTLVRGKDGNFYGLTISGGVLSGGAAANGTAFKITPAGVLTTLHAFDEKVDGGDPVGALFQGTDDNFYGAADAGGPANGTPYYGYGTIFKMTPAGALTVVHTFNYTSGINGDTFNGAAPEAGVVLGGDGDFYGTTAGGGQGNAATNLTGYGTVFKLTPAGTLTTLFRATGGGLECNARLVESPEGTFYSTTEYGGASGIGTIFGVTPTGQLVTEYSFDDAVTGAYPCGGLVTDGKGTYYGQTSIDGPNGWGTLYKATEVAPKSSAETQGFRPQDVGYALYMLEIDYLRGELAQEKSPDAGEASQPEPDPYLMKMAMQSAVEYCMRMGGGAKGTQNDEAALMGTDAGSAEGPGDDGAVMQQVLTTDGSANGSGTPPAPTVLYAFTGGTDGGEPIGATYIDSAGNAYGTTSIGGANGQGTVFEVTAGGTLKTLYSFKGKGDGAFPAAGLIVGKDGNFYGTTEFATFSTAGVGAGSGTVFKLTPAGVLTTLHTFKDTPDGAMPEAELIVGKDGNFYGTTEQGGDRGAGTVFKMTPAGTLTILHSFTGVDGGNPVAAMIEAKNGYLYGTTSSSVFRVVTVPPVISSPAAATGTEGKAFSYQITASNQPTSFGVSGLFGGLTVNKETGLISGTPTVSGKHTLTPQATNAFGTGTKTLVLTVTN